MPERIHLVVREVEKERYRQQAELEGVSLSEWLREAAEEKLGRASGRPRLETVEALRSFFAECDERAGPGTEPDWQDHRRVIEESIGSGARAK